VGKHSAYAGTSKGGEPRETTSPFMNGIRADANEYAVEGILGSIVVRPI
jgi:hypothetical protein